MLLCCRVLLQVSPPGGCLLALSTKETFLQSRLESRRGGKHRGRQAFLQNLDSGSEICRKEKIVQWDFAILMAELRITRYLPKVTFSFVTINILYIVSEHCGCLFWNQGNCSKWWVEAGCDQRSSQTAHPTSTLFLGANRSVGKMFSTYAEKVWKSSIPYLNFIPGGEQVCRQSVFNLCRESLKIKNTLHQLHFWGWTGL